MKYQKPTFEIWEQESGLDGMYKHCERVSRVCYDSQDKSKNTVESGKDFVNRMMKSGHGEMLEHMTVYLTLNSDVPKCKGYARLFKKNKYSYVHKDKHIYYVTTNYRVLLQGSHKTFIKAFQNNYKSNWLDVLDYWTEPTEFHEVRKTVYMEIDRCTGESFIRHRVFSKARQSTRACDYTKDKYEGITCITPCWEVSPQASQILDLALSASETYYAELRKLGWTAEQARIVLPFDIKSPLVMTGTVDEWKEFCDVRADGVVGRPHPQSVEITEQIKKEMFK